MTNNAPTWRSTEDLVALLAAVDREGVVEAARQAVTAAQADRDAKRQHWHRNREGMAGVTIDVPGASEAMAALKQMGADYRAAERALADAKALLTATEKAVHDELEAIAGPACLAAAQRILEAAAEIESAASVIEATKLAADARRLPRIFPYLVMRAASEARHAQGLARDLVTVITPPAPVQPKPPTPPRAPIQLGGGFVLKADDTIGFQMPGKAA